MWGTPHDAVNPIWCAKCNAEKNSAAKEMWHMHDCNPTWPAHLPCHAIHIVWLLPQPCLVVYVYIIYIYGKKPFMVFKIYMKEINFKDICGDTVSQQSIWQNYQVLEEHWQFYFSRMLNSDTTDQFYYNKLKQLDNRMIRLTVLLHSPLSAN